jgi:hypothetical protein
LALGYLCQHLLSLVLAHRTGPARALADYMAGSRAEERSDPLMGSRRYQIGLAFSAFGLDVSGHEETALYLAYGVLGLALWLPLYLFHFPTAIWLAAPFLAYVAVNAVIDGKWTEMRLELEKELPTFLMRLASYLQTSPNLIQGLDEVAEGLDPQKPLKAWMQRLAGELQAGGKAALERMQEEAGGISSSLLLAVVEIGRLWETGGQGYTQALKLAAENMADLLETRAQAHAVAAGAWGTARTILLALALTLGVTLSNPISRPAMNMPLIQFALLFAMVWAGIGYRQIKDLVDSVVE